MALMQECNRRELLISRTKFVFFWVISLFFCKMNTVSAIKNRKLSGNLTFEERLQLKGLGVPRPDLSLKQTSIVKNKTVTRHFNHRFYECAEWLCGCAEQNAFFCFVCLVMDKGDCDKSWVETGVKDLKHLGEKIKKHKIAARHLFYAVEYATLGRVNIQNQLDSAYRLNVKKHNEEVKHNRYILSKLIDCIKFCGAFEVALRGHDERETSSNPGIFRGLVNLLAEVDNVLKTHIEKSQNKVFSGLSKTIQNELLDSILEVSLQLIKDEITQCDYIAIEADEATDNSTISQLVFIVRYVLNGVIHERFMGFFTPTAPNAEAISTCIFNELEKPKLNERPEKLIAETYD